MAFLKITDPTKREFFVNELVNARKNILNNSINERIGDISQQRELTKQYKPLLQGITTASSELANIKENLSTTNTALQALPTTLSESMKNITFPQFPSVQALEDVPADPPIELGEIATAYLRKFTDKVDSTDRTFGIYDKDGKFYIGDTVILFNGNNIIVGDKEYKGSAGLWELIVSKEPDDEIYTARDKDNYIEILMNTNAMRENNDPNENHPKASRSAKWLNLLSPIWLKYISKSVKGKGLRNPVILPCDPTALVDRLDLLLASKQAGNTGVRNEIIAVCDELLRQDTITKDAYRQLMLLI